MIKELFSQQLREARKSAGLTQQELADRCEMSLRYLQNLEKGEKQPTITTLFKLAAGLKTTPQQLIKSIWEQWHKG